MKVFQAYLFYFLNVFFLLEAAYFAVQLSAAPLIMNHVDSDVAIGLSSFATIPASSKSLFR